MFKFKHNPLNCKCNIKHQIIFNFALKRFYFKLLPCTYLLRFLNEGIVYSFPDLRLRLDCQPVISTIQETSNWHKWNKKQTKKEDKNEQLRRIKKITCILKWSNIAVNSSFFVETIIPEDTEILACFIFFF